MDWAKLLLPLAARYCRSAQLLLAHGPDSPEWIEYALRNQVEGRTWLGRRLDAYYLNQLECHGLRASQDAARTFLRSFVERRQAYSLDTVVLDLGVACASYAWPLLRETKHLSLICLRRSPREVWFGRSVVPPEVAGRCEFVIGDRLDAASYLMRREPDLAICVAPRWDDFSVGQLAQLGSLVHSALAPAGAFLFVTSAPPEPVPRKTQPWRTPTAVGAVLNAAGFQNVHASRSDPALVAVGWKLPATARRELGG